MKHLLCLSTLALCSWCSVTSALAADPFQIVNGQLATEDDILATVAVLSADGEQVCTGTLITPQIVATAAHCLLADESSTTYLRADDLGVTLGALDVRDADENLKRVYEVERVYGACGFLERKDLTPSTPSGFGREDDIAFLRLAQSVDANMMTPISVLPDAKKDEIRVGSIVTISGYGLYDLDAKASGVLHITTSEIAQINAHELMTIRNPQGEGMDSCSGDSGGPLYFTALDNNRYLAGVVARGVNDSDFECGDGGIYTRVTSYRALYQQAVNNEDPSICGNEPDLDDLTLAGFFEDACLYDCCGGAPNEDHPLCDACSDVANTCEDPQEAYSVEGFDAALDELCERDCPAGDMHPVCQQCEDATPKPTPAPATPDEEGDDGCGLCTVSSGSKPPVPLLVMMCGVALLVSCRRRE